MIRIAVASALATRGCLGRGWIRYGLLPDGRREYDESVCMTGRQSWSRASRTWHEELGTPSI